MHGSRPIDEQGYVAMADALPYERRRRQGRKDGLGFSGCSAGVRLGHIFYLFLLISSLFLVATGFQEKK
jgi:hypothetical protein